MSRLLRQLFAGLLLLGVLQAVFVKAEEDEDEPEVVTPKATKMNDAVAGHAGEDENEDESADGIEDPDDNDPDLVGGDEVEETESEPMSHDVAKAKAKLCLFASRAQANPQNELLKGALESYVKHSEGKLDQNQAQEMIMIHLFSRCWKQANNDVVTKISSESVGPEEEPFKSFIADNGLDKPLNPMKEQLKKEEWDIVHEVLEEERKLSGENPAKESKGQRQKREKREYKRANSDVFGAPGVNMSSFSKYIYTIVVLAAFFSVCFWGLKKLQNLESTAKPVEKRVNEKKAMEKAKKEAAKLAKKKLA